MSCVHLHADTLPVQLHALPDSSLVLLFVYISKAMSSHSWTPSMSAWRGAGVPAPASSEVRDSEGNVVTGPRLQTVRGSVKDNARYAPWNSGPASSSSNWQELGENEEPNDYSRDSRGSGSNYWEKPSDRDPRGSGPDGSGTKHMPIVVMTEAGTKPAGESTPRLLVLLAVSTPEAGQCQETTQAPGGPKICRQGGRKCGPQGCTGEASKQG